MTAETVTELSIAEAVELPGFSAHVREFVNRLAVEGGAMTLSEVAAILGEEERGFLLRMVGEMVTAEVARLVNAPDRGALN